MDQFFYLYQIYTALYGNYFACNVFFFFNYIVNFATSVFVVYLVIAFIAWRLLPFRLAKIWLCFASLFFYSYWFPPFLFLLFTSGIIDYIAAIKIVENPTRKRLFLAMSMTANLAILFTFKYYNFFQESLSYIIQIIEPNYTPHNLDLILPMGISFYTFQSMSYTIDVYRNELKPVKSLNDFFLYLSFFPQLVAGPIVRAVDFIPQMDKKNAPIDWTFIIYRITRGFFLKIVIADNISSSVNYIFSMPSENLSFLAAWLGSITFAIQILCDFSGYSDIAIGTAALFGFRLNENFNFPYISKSPSEFWSRWHISLSTWFRDYLYIPLGGNRLGGKKTAFNLMFVFLVSGLWHGAKFTFIIWGFLHGLGVLIEKYIFPQFFKSKRKISQIICYLGTLWLVLMAWVPFRAVDSTHTLNYWKSMYSSTWGNTSGFNVTFLFILLFMFSQVFSYLSKKNINLKYFEICIYFILILIFPGATSDFIYFQF